MQFPSKSQRLWHCLMLQSLLLLVFCQQRLNAQKLDDSLYHFNPGFFVKVNLAGSLIGRHSLWAEFPMGKKNALEIGLGYEYHWSKQVKDFFEGLETYKYQGPEFTVRYKWYYPNGFYIGTGPQLSLKHYKNVELCTDGSCGLSSTTLENWSKWKTGYHWQGVMGSVNYHKHFITETYIGLDATYWYTKQTLHSRRSGGVYTYPEKTSYKDKFIPFVVFGFKIGLW